MSHQGASSLDWKLIMDRYESSGLSQKKFCNENDINYSNFKTYRYGKSNKGKIKQPKSVKSTFTEVKLKEQPAPKSQLRLIHSSGIECLLPSSLKDHTIINIVRGLQAC